jgi:hypothetical protein
VLVDLKVMTELWIPVTCTDDRLRGLYRRHYSAAKATRRRGRPIDHPNQLRFVGPGEYIALLTPGADAGFVWRMSRYRKDRETGVECTLFRNEGTETSSALIRAATRLAQARWPGLRLFTFVDPARVRSTNPGYCFIRAGWKRLERTTARGLRVLEVAA